MTTFEKLIKLCQLQIPEPYLSKAIENLNDAYKLGFLEGGSSMLENVSKMNKQNSAMEDHDCHLSPEDSCDCVVEK